MSAYNLLKIISRALFPFVLLYGLYIIFGGDISPGGGFQGGVVLATSYLILHFISGRNIVDVGGILRAEKVLFLILLVVAFSSMFTKSLPICGFAYGYSQNLKEFNLILLNLIIGIKVTLGIVGIMAIFIEEGNA